MRRTVLTIICLTLLNNVALASEIPDFLSHKSSVSTAPAQKNNNSLNDLPDSLPSSTTQAPKETSEPGNTIDRFRPNEDADKFMAHIIRLRKDIIVDTLRQRRHVLEKGLGLDLDKYPVLPPKGSQPDLGPGVTIKKRGIGIKVISILGTKVMVSYHDSKEWVTLGSKVGKYTVKAIASKTATFADPTGKEYVVKKAPKVIPRPPITVESVDNNTANIVYNNKNYSVTINASLGDNLTVTALTPQELSVTDANGRVFTYPVPVQQNTQQGPYQRISQPYLTPQQQASTPTDAY